MHSKQPVHWAWLTEAMPSDKCIAPLRQTTAQAPQEMHLSAEMAMTIMLPPFYPGLHWSKDIIKHIGKKSIQKRYAQKRTDGKSDLIFEDIWDGISTRDGANRMTLAGIMTVFNECISPFCTKKARNFLRCKIPLYGIWHCKNYIICIQWSQRSRGISSHRLGKVN